MKEEPKDGNTPEEWLEWELLQDPERNHGFARRDDTLWVAPEDEDEEDEDEYGKEW